jgi:plastocyanin
MSRSAFYVCLLVVATLAAAVPAVAQPGNKEVVTVAFGIGMNTPVTSAANHHVLPEVIKVKQGGVVNFVVSGVHQIVIYNPGRDLSDLVVPPAPALLVNDLSGTFYVGPVATGGVAAPAGWAVASDGTLPRNRVEPVTFEIPGRYLVICNIRPHLVNGMWAIVEVEPGGM